MQNRDGIQEERGKRKSLRSKQQQQEEQTKQQQQRGPLEYQNGQVALTQTRSNISTNTIGDEDFKEKQQKVEDENEMRTFATTNENTNDTVKINIDTDPDKKEHSKFRFHLFHRSKQNASESTTKVIDDRTPLISPKVKSSNSEKKMKQNRHTSEKSINFATDTNSHSSKKKSKKMKYEVATACEGVEEDKALLTAVPLTDLKRTRSFPDDIYSGNRLLRFHINEMLRNSAGETIMSWLNKGKPPKEDIDNENLGMDDDEHKKLKAQHLESFDYDPFDSRVNMQYDYEQTENEVRSLNLGRWIMTLLIGLMTALVACFIEIFTDLFSEFRRDAFTSFILKEQMGEVAFGTAFAVYFGISLGFVFVAAYGVAILCPVAGGSGISEIKASLNGIKIHRVVRLKTLFCKAIGVLFSVSGGLPSGKEGPMIHSGAIIGAGLSQGKSSSFGLDTSWTKFKGFRNDKEKRDFISSGAAAGVAAAFGAPIGGVLFALEEGASFWHQSLTWRTFFCAMISAFVLNLFLTVGDTASSNWGTLGTQTGTFSFGVFGGSKSYACWEIVLFILMGVIAGLFGALFNECNTKLTKFRMKYITNKWGKLLEVLVIASVVSTTSFWLSYFFGTCLERTGPYQEDLVTFYCPEPNQYNDLASLYTISYSISTKQLLHHTIPDAVGSSFTFLSLCCFFFSFYILACWTYGVSVPSGLFVPSLLSGAAYGRICVYLVHYFQVPLVAPDGMFALIGAAATLGGVARMTISLTVIILECTGVIEWGLPIMVTLMAARWVGNYFNEGLYDIHIHLRKYPFLEFDPPFYCKYLRVENIMSKDVQVVYDVTKAGVVYDLLKNTNHNGFPVLQSNSSSGTPRFVGIILRKHLSVLLQKKDFIVERPTPYIRKPASETTFLYNEQYALSYKDIESNYPRYPTIQEIKLDSVERDLWMDLTPYINQTPHIVDEQTLVPRAFRLFRSLGLRHLVIVNRHNEVKGIISRKDLTPAHLKKCLESLSELEKHKIQDYFHRGRSRSGRFEDTEKSLLKLPGGV